MMSLIPPHKKDAMDSGIHALWQASDVAQILGIRVKTVHNLVRKGKLACVQVTVRERRFTQEQVHEYIRSQSTEVRVDKKPLGPVSSPARKGGEKSSGVSRAELRKELRSWL